PEQQLRSLLAQYDQADSAFWVQEEPENMGPGPFACARLPQVLPGHIKLGYVGRAESGSPATGSALVHSQELDDLLEAAFDGI
ncbi:MAG TPA: hypothetical protein VEA78_12470, partial [Acidimicrobiales bacterium]|nr:hypothetical protein [Acidimicrobiales bacterium]